MTGSLLLTLLSVNALSQPDPQDKPIRVDVNAVNVLVTVIDREGRFVTDLKEEQFEIFENGKRQEITNFSHETDLPLDIGLLIDTSASVRTQLDFEKQSARNFLFAVMKPRDRALLVEFDSGVQMISDFSNQPSRVARQLEGLRAGGGTRLLDAVYAVCRDKMSRAGARRTVVLVSDGADRDSSQSVDEAVDMAHHSGVVIYAIGTSRFTASGTRKGEEVLRNLAEKTGGRVFFPYSPDQLQGAFQMIDTELRSQYSITFTPEDLENRHKFRRLRVKLRKAKDYELRYRNGYYISESPGAG